VALSTKVAVLFIRTMSALIISLNLFLREILRAVNFGRLQSPH
jgi:hypothetical protein